MITYNKRKNSSKWYLPYLNIAVLAIIIGVFTLMNFQVAETEYLIENNVAEAQVAITIEDVDISGEWVGTLTEDYNTEVRYDYRVVFDQFNDELGGFSFQDSINYDIEIYAESAIAGDVDGHDIYFYEESTLVLDNLSLDRWCRIEVRLNYQVIDGQETLIGTWDSAEEDRAGCTTIDGRVILTRQD